MDRCLSILFREVCPTDALTEFWPDKPGPSQTSICEDNDLLWHLALNK